MNERVQEARDAVRVEWERMHGERIDENAPWEVVARQFPWVEKFALHLLAVRAERVEVPVETVERERLAALERWWKDHADDRQESAVLAEGYRNAGLAVTAALEASR